MPERRRPTPPGRRGAPPADCYRPAGPASALTTPDPSARRAGRSAQEIAHMRAIALPLAAAAALLLVAAPLRAEDKPAVIVEGSKVSLEYTLKLDDGRTVDSNVGGEPLDFEQGKHQILPALEKQLLGLGVNDTKQVTLSAEDGYGVVDPDLVREVPASQIPAEGQKPGAQLIAQDQEGKQRMVKVVDVKGDTIVLDLNHPLAGQRLHFDVKVLGIR
jgi:FKBP-type peptidyl-prolyl cis-trans isomerase SlyD